VEEVSDNPPWVGHILRRPWKVALETPEGLESRTTLPWYENFPARTEAIAKDSAALTVRNGFGDYAHRVGELQWKEFNLTEEEWKAEHDSFTRP
jgi:hypothetical protein